MTGRGRGGPASRISPLCGTLLSGERSRSTPNSSHVLFIACPATHDGEDEFGRLCDREDGDVCSWVHLLLFFSFQMHVDPLVSFPSLRRVCLFVQGQRQSRAVSQRVGVFGLGQGF